MKITQWFLEVKVRKPYGKYRGAIFPCLSEQEAKEKETKAKQDYGEQIETKVYCK